MQEIVEKLALEFSLGNLEDFLRSKNPDFMIYSPPERLYGYEEDAFEEVYKIGELKLKDAKNLWVFAIKTAGELTERSSKKRQYEFAKRIIKDSFINAGIFVFYDDTRNFRFSLVYSVSQGTKSKFSYYKRYTYYVAKGKPYRTFVKALTEVKFESLQDIISAFSVQKLTRDFYIEIQNWYAWALKCAWFPGGISEENLIRLLTRLIFVWFLKERKLVPEQIFKPEFLKGVVKDFGKANYYYNVILQNLFFGTLNRYSQDRRFTRNGEFEINRTEFGIKTLYRYQDKLLIDQRDFLKIFEAVPFVNGGLFECLDEDKRYIDGFSRNEYKRAKLPDFLFFGDEQEVDLSDFYGQTKRGKVRGLVKILRDYNFTADESSPIDIEVSLDPELLGHIFENLLASYNPETKTTARKATGSYYTPKEIVEFMVDESLIEYLKAKTNIEDEKLRRLLSYSDGPELTDEEKSKITKAVDSLKVIDPAVGSGAFPMGVLHKLVHVLNKIDPNNTLWYELQYQKALREVEEILKIRDKTEREELLRELNENFDDSINYPDYARKLYLIENAIYGVDIQSIAVQICKLRFFLSLIIDQKVSSEKDNYGIRALPHLETKFVSANALIGIEKPKQLAFEDPKIKALKKELKELYNKHFKVKTRSEKKEINKKAVEIRNKLKELLINDGWRNETASKIASFDIFDQTATADWFDPEWMFGVDEGFDIVIGNPPHGAKIDNIKNKIRDIYKFYEKRKNSASLFLELAYTLLKEGGITCFVIPKSFTFVSSWKKIRDFVLFNNRLLFVVDVSKAFENVKLEQILLAYKRTKLNKDYEFKTGDYWKEEVRIISFNSSTGLAKKLDLLPIYIDDDKLRVFARIMEDSVLLGQISETFRGLPFQRKIVPNGNIPILRGDNLGKYLIYGRIPKVSLSKTELNNKKLNRLRQRKIVSQNIVAHVMNPFDRIIVMATLDNEGYLTLDTVMNTFIIDSSFSYLYVLGILNSRLAEWFYYWFVYSRAIRTMHFDEYYMGKLPIKKITSQNKNIVCKIEQLVDKTLSFNQNEVCPEDKEKRAQIKEYQTQIDQLVYKLYDLTPEEIEVVEENDS